MSKRPVLIDLDDTAPAPSPGAAPPVPDSDLPQGTAMQAVATLAARPRSRLGRLFWGLAMMLLGAMVSVAMWNFATRLIAQMPVIGYAVTGLIGALLLVALVIALRELAGFARLRRLDDLHHDANTALADNDLGRARSVIKRLDALYRDREDARWGLDRLRDYGPDQFDAGGLLGLAETDLLAPFDAAAQAEVQAAARQVATVTALVPIALADVVTALAANLRMIRRIAEIYGGRAGVLGSWRLTRAVMAHLVATGAVAVGDDMLEPLIGGGLLGKLSRRFGEGLVNGALTARVGVAAMEVCRPLPFARVARPSASAVVRRALSGLFTGGGKG